MKVIMNAQDIADAISLWGERYHPEWIGKYADWWLRIDGDKISIELQTRDRETSDG